MQVCFFKGYFCPHILNNKGTTPPPSFHFPNPTQLLVETSTPAKVVPLNSTQQSPEPEDPKPESVIVILAANRQNSNQELMEPETPLEPPMKKYSPNLRDNLEMASGSELSRTPQMEKPLLKQSITSDQDVSSVKSKKKSAFSSFKPSVYRKTPKVPTTPAKPITPRIKKESNSSASATSAAAPITIKSSSDYVEKKKGSTPKSLRTFIREQL